MAFPATSRWCSSSSWSLSALPSVAEDCTSNATPSSPEKSDKSLSACFKSEGTWSAKSPLPGAPKRWASPSPSISTRCQPWSSESVLPAFANMSSACSSDRQPCQRPALVESGTNISEKIASSIPSMKCTTGAWLSLLYSRALLLPGSTWYPANRWMSPGAWALHIQDNTVALAEWVPIACVGLTSRCSPSTSRSHIAASEGPRGSEDHPPPLTPIENAIALNLSESIRPVSPLTNQNECKGFTHSTKATPLQKWLPSKKPAQL